ncbi:hypothetical protein JHD50_07465 [Sulfurimonas sp. MAG313]|nr:hypothetical protein [Sulfurimonas sp. MAG313]MDF1881140.1 hypothetical protein [Sulfurimonas sp. MAG313]
MSHDVFKDAPAWAIELLNEVQELKSKIKNSKKYTDSKGFYDFVNDFRKTMQAKPLDNSYPEVQCNGKRLGVTFSNLLYDKENGEVIPRQDAFVIYRRLYNKSKDVL